MEKVDQILHPKWLIQNSETVLTDHALVIHQGHIRAILPSQKVGENYNATETLHFKNHAFFPGFVNAHTHVGMNLFRGLADDLKLMDWLENHMWPAEKKCLSAEFVKDASLFAIAEMLRSGTTCFNDMFFFMPSIAEAIIQSGIRGATGPHIITFQTNWAKNAEEEFAKGMDFYEHYKNHERIIPTISLHSLYTVKEDHDLQRAWQLAEKWNLKVNIHVQEPASEIDIIQNQYQCRPLERLKKLGMLNDRLIAIHMLHVNEEDLQLLADNKPNVVHCPESNMKLASGFCPVDQLIAKGVNVALGTDSTASNNDLDMIGEMRTAAFLAKHQTYNSESLNAKIVFKMATLNGAKALGIDHLMGTLQAGKSADFAAIDLNQIETQPIYHLIPQIVYAASRHQITDVWVAGKQLLKNRVLTTLDEKELLEKAKYWQEKIAAR